MEENKNGKIIDINKVKTAPLGGQKIVRNPAIPIGMEKQLEKALQHQKIMSEEACIKQVLRILLDREPTIEDAKLCSQILSDPWDGTYRLLYNRVEIGTVRYIDTEEKFRVEFVPIQKLN